MPTRRVLILTAAMGAGHDGVAAELARRLAADGVGADLADVLDLLPFRLGAGLRRWYAWTMRHTPWAYAAIYRVFFTRVPAVSPLTLLAAARLDALVRRLGPAAVVSTFHVGAQAAGHLRARGRLPVPSVVLLTDFAVHRLWLHPGNDGYLCPTPEAARDVRTAIGRPAWCHAPVVRAEFGWGAAPAALPGPRPVLVAAGAWGVGRVVKTARTLARSGRYRPVVLCGGNERLRRRLERTGTCLAMGWRDDLPELMAAAYALVDNASGLTCKEALAAGVPVICHRPIPGHGRDGALALARAGLGEYARDAAELIAALDRLGSPAERDRRVARGRAAFGHPAAEALLSALLP